MNLSKNQLQHIFNDCVSDIEKVYDAREAKSIAYILFEYLFGYTRTDIQLYPDKRLSESEIIRVVKSKNRLLNHEPIQHITGVQFFCDLEFKVNKHVLIPRPETEELVRWVVKSLPASAKCWEVGTGSGCIAIATKALNKSCEMYASDVSEEALAVAKWNAENLSIEVDFLLHDILKDDLPNELDTLDCIISNPPYIAPDESSEMIKQVTDFEPSLALFTPNSETLVFYKRIAEIGTTALKQNGLLFFECHEKYASDVAKMMKVQGYKDVELRVDFQEKPRMVVGKRP